MASNDEDEGQGSGDCNDVYLATDEFLNLANDQRLLLLGPPITSETDIETGTKTGVETQTGTKTGEAGIEPKPKRRRRHPNQLITTRVVVTEVDDGNFEPKAPEEARRCYDNHIGCIVRTTATINDEKLKKIENMKHSLLTKLH